MNIQEQRNFYNQLDMCNVTHEHTKTRIIGNIFCITDSYTFGDYNIEFEENSPSSMLTPMGEVWIRKKESNGSNNFLASWNEHHPEKQYVYDMFIAAKNRAEGKNYINPFRMKFLGLTAAKTAPKTASKGHTFVNPLVVFGHKLAGIIK